MISRWAVVIGLIGGFSFYFGASIVSSWVMRVVVAVTIGVAVITVLDALVDRWVYWSDHRDRAILATAELAGQTDSTPIASGN